MKSKTPNAMTDPSATRVVQGWCYGWPEPVCEGEPVVIVQRWDDCRVVSDHVAIMLRADYEALVAERDRWRWGSYFPVLRAELDRLQAALAASEQKVAELRQAYWEARAIMGFDNDGNPTPDALVYPSLPDLMKRDAMEMRGDYDAALNQERSDG